MNKSKFISKVESWDEYKGRIIMEKREVIEPCFKVFKKCRLGFDVFALVELWLMKDQIYYKSIGESHEGKCRTNTAYVRQINLLGWDDGRCNILTSTKLFIAASSHDKEFIYEESKIVSSELDPITNGACAKGIHFFETLEDALNYGP